jgi:hypothetical protein
MVTRSLHYQPLCSNLVRKNLLVQVSFPSAVVSTKKIGHETMSSDTNSSPLDSCENSTKLEQEQINRGVDYRPKKKRNRDKIAAVT